MFERLNAKKVTHLVYRDVHVQTNGREHFVGLLFSAGPKLHLIWNNAGFKTSQYFEWSEIKNIERCTFDVEKETRWPRR